MSKWLALRCYGNPGLDKNAGIVPGEVYDYPILIANSLWYFEGIVYKIVSKAGGMVTYAPEPLTKTSIDQSVCDMINDLPLEVLPKYLHIGMEGRYYFSHLVKHRLRCG